MWPSNLSEGSDLNIEKHKVFLAIEDISFQVHSERQLPISS